MTVYTQSAENYTAVSVLSKLVNLHTNLFIALQSNIRVYAELIQQLQYFILKLFYSTY